MSLLLYSEVHTLVTIVTAAKDGMWCNHGNPTMQHKISKYAVEQGSPHKFEPSNFKIVQAMKLKLLHRGPLEWYQLCTKFHENLPISSKVISGGSQAVRQTADLIRLI
jgi:hypothetical protein